MKTPNVTLGNVLLIIAAIGVGFASYLSIYFITLGDVKESIIGAVITALILAGLAFAAQKLKSINKNFKTNIILEIIALVLFIVAAFFALQPFSHVFTVMRQKEDITNKVGQNIAQAQKMFDDYEDYANSRIDTYKSTLKAVVANKKADPSEYKAYGFEGDRADDDQIQTMIFRINAKLFPSNFDNDTTRNEDGIKGAAVKWLGDVSSSVNSEFGFMFGIVQTVNEVPEKIEEWKSNLINLSEFRAVNEEANDFEFSLDFKSIKDQLTTVKTPAVLSVILMILICILMLVSHYAVTRGPKSPYVSIISFIFSNNKKDNSQKDEDINIYTD